MENGERLGLKTREWVKAVKESLALSRLGLFFIYFQDILPQCYDPQDQDQSL